MFDVIILGGGLAGLTLSLQLKQSLPELKILVIEKDEGPVPEAAFKVGESTVEIGSHYLAKILNLQDHLETNQLLKAGLRFFFSNDDNSDISKRIEMGGSHFPLNPSYQLDRGKFENFLRARVKEKGIELQEGATVKTVNLEEQYHKISYIKNNTEVNQETRWVVDATGRFGFLKRQLNLKKPVNHEANAVWFRLDKKIDIDKWSDCKEWHQHTPENFRYYSTNHLLGEGYWVWVIPLSSGATSVGIVYDADKFGFSSLNTFDKALQWLHDFEPQCAKEITENKHLVQDFHALKNFSYSCEQVFSPKRWCLTGEAGVFLDPFYSPGSDFIGMSNSFITEMIAADFNGKNIRKRALFYNRIYLNLFQGFLPIYNKQYPLMGHEGLMALKISWDHSSYWGFTALLFFHGALTDIRFMQQLTPYLEKFNKLNLFMQKTFNLLSQENVVIKTNKFIDVLNVKFMKKLHNNLSVDYSREALLKQIIESIDLLTEFAVFLLDRYDAIIASKLSEDDLLFVKSFKRINVHGVAESLSGILL